MSASRYSTPPSAEKLEETTRKLEARNNSLERSVGHLPTPLAIRIAAVEVTDEQRLAVIRELRAKMARGYGNAYADIDAYEAEAKAGVRK